MDKPFFIMCYTQKGNAAFPIMDDNDDCPAFYETEDVARSVADKHFLASNFGYEIFEMGTGE